MTPDGSYVVMTVCLGNICRSPMAAAVLRHKVAAAGLASQVSVESTGTGGWHVGEPADARAGAVLAAYGYDPQHTAQQFAADRGADLDLILAMDSANWRSLTSMMGADPRLRMFRSFDPALAGIPAPDPRLDVPDPYYGGTEGFTEVLRMIEQAADGVITYLAAHPAMAGR